jgi:hypothetical protein
LEVRIGVRIKIGVKVKVKVKVELKLGKVGSNLKSKLGIKRLGWG